ncbi:uncharacterized protein LOC112055592 [Bicyclus anynana]|uniref:Uncharacterized protein LOC112055592 n=1 Tax=Bicyclus anynana TaxID=110368 RepID=A0A6J1P292_BICAN|nr:uncharacterized protein LOC112055592 [Bicyclus anynana]
MKSAKVFCCLAFIYVSISSCCCEKNGHKNEPVQNPHLKEEERNPLLNNAESQKNGDIHKDVLKYTNSKKDKSDSEEDIAFQKRTTSGANKNDYKLHEFKTPTSDSQQTSEEGESNSEEYSSHEEYNVDPFKKRRPDSQQPYWIPYTRPLSQYKPPYDDGSYPNSKPTHHGESYLSSSSLGGLSQSNKPPKGKPSQGGSSYHERPPTYGRPPSHHEKPPKDKPPSHGGSAYHERPPSHPSHGKPPKDKPSSHHERPPTHNKPSTQHNKPPKDKPPTLSGSSYHEKPQSHHEKPSSHHEKPHSHHEKPPSHHEKPPHQEKPHSHHHKPPSQGGSSHHEKPPSYGESSESSENEKPSSNHNRPSYGKPPSNSKPTSQSESCCKEKPITNDNPQSYHNRPPQNKPSHDEHLHDNYESHYQHPFENKPQNDEETVGATGAIDMNKNEHSTPPKPGAINNSSPDQAVYPLHPLLFQAKPVIPANEMENKYRYRHTSIVIK